MATSGSGKRKIMFIGGLPGETEDRQGRHMVGEAGELLREVLDEIGVNLDKCWATNAVLCRPPKNPKQAQPIGVYVDACRPAILKAIKELQPRVIILLGASGVDSVISPAWHKDTGKIDKWAGWRIPMREHNAWVCPTYHPSQVLQGKGNPLMRKIMKDHIRAALKLEKKPINVPTQADLEKQVEIITKEKDVKLRLKDLLRKRGELAFDYETTGLKPDRDAMKIVSCSFCLDGEDTFAFPMTQGVERLLSRVLRKPKLRKIASNLKFEERWTIAKLGHGVRGWHWDTMLAAHCLDNRSGITSIKFQAFIELGVADYSSHIEKYLKGPTPNEPNNIHKLNMQDLLLYNGMDSLLEYLVAKRQMEVLG